MQVYSRRPTVRTRQIVGDVVALVAIAVSVALGVTVGATIAGLADFGRQVEESASGLESRLGDAARSLGEIPLVGQSASSPLQGASSAAATLAEAGREQQQIVGGIAVAVGLVVALVPIAVVLLVWLRRRVAFVRRAAEANALSGSVTGVELLALRSLLTLRERDLRAIGSNPVQGWRQGDPAAIRMLADRTLRDAGVL